MPFFIVESLTNSRSVMIKADCKKDLILKAMDKLNLPDGNYEVRKILNFYEN